jgi:hypothetical protein
MALDCHTQLREPLTLDKLQVQQATIANIVNTLRSDFRKPLYFPFDHSRQPLRRYQGYAFKLPSAFVSAFPELEEPILPTASPSWISGLMPRLRHVSTHTCRLYHDHR